MKRVTVIILLLPIITSLVTQGIPANRPILTPPTPLFHLQPHGDVSIILNTSGVAYGHELLWIANTTGTNYEESAVTVIDGTAYIGSCSTHGEGHDKLFAVNTTTGTIIWSNDTGPGYVGPVIDGDTVYLGSCTHGNDPSHEYLFAFNRTTGQQRWKIPIYGGIAESIQIDNTKLYFGTGFYQTKVYAVFKNNGTVRWTYNTNCDVGPNKPMLKDNTVYVAFWKDYGIGYLYKINATTGQAIWVVPLSSGPWDNSITTDGQGRLFLAIYADSTMNAYQDSNGGLIWSKPLHASPLSFNAYHNEHVFIADTGGYVYCFNAADGLLVWETKVGDDCDISSPTLSGGLLFIGTRDGSDGAYLAVNETTGAILWRYPIGASVTAPPTIVNGMMLCGSDGWNLYAFDVGLGNGDWLRHRYDSWNTAYSPVGLTQWQYARASCTSQQGIITCIVTNTYDHTIHNISLNIPYPAYWYSENGTLLAVNATMYTIDNLPADGSCTLLITQEPFLQVTITKPENAIYVRNTKILSFPVPLAFGHLDIEAIPVGNLSTIDRIEFSLDGVIQTSDTTAPYQWSWTIRSFGVYQVSATAYQGNKTASVSCRVWKFF
jgi:outer membrane protein assembly factor BamB